MQTNTRYIVIAAVVLIAIVLGLYLNKGAAPTSPMDLSTTTLPSLGGTTTKPSSAAIDIGTVPASVEYTVTPKGNWSAAQAPDFKTPIAFSGTISTTLRGQLTDGLKKLQDMLSKDPHIYGTWLSLGTVHKMGGDYAFAATVWEYLSKVAPSSPASFYNLGDLFQNYTHDFAKAEANYLLAIQKAPKDTNAYRALFTLYTEQYKTDSNAGEKILLQGEKAIPDAVDLYVLLARYYKEKGDTSKAKAQYEAAIAAATRLKQGDLVKEIKAEAQLQ